MRRRVGLFLFCGLVLPLVATASASAQGAVLRVSKQVVTVGETITIEGSGFSNTGVFIRIGPTRDSPVDRETSGQTFSTTLTIPARLTPGWHLVHGTQVTVPGRHRGFTPGRTRIRVVAASAAAGGAPGGGGLTDAGPPTPLVLAIVGLVILAGTTTLAVRRVRTLNRPLGN